MTTTVENCTRARNEDGTVLLCSAKHVLFTQEQRP